MISILQVSFEDKGTSCLFTTFLDSADKMEKAYLHVKNLLSADVLLVDGCAWNSEVACSQCEWAWPWKAGACVANATGGSQQWLEANGRTLTRIPEVAARSELHPIGWSETTWASRDWCCSRMWILAMGILQEGAVKVGLRLHLGTEQGPTPSWFSLGEI